MSSPRHHEPTEGNENQIPEPTLGNKKLDLVQRRYVRRHPRIEKKRDPLRLIPRTYNIVPRCRNRKALSADAASEKPGTSLAAFFKEAEEKSVQNASAPSQEKDMQQNCANKQSQEHVVADVEQNEPRFMQSDPADSGLSRGKEPIVDSTVKESGTANKEAEDHSKPKEKTFSLNKNQNDFKPLLYPWNDPSPWAQYEQYMKTPKVFSSEFADALYYKVGSSKCRINPEFSTRAFLRLPNAFHLKNLNLRLQMDKNEKNVTASKSSSISPPKEPVTASSNLESPKFVVRSLPVSHLLAGPTLTIQGPKGLPMEITLPHPLGPPMCVPFPLSNFPRGLP